MTVHPSFRRVRVTNRSRSLFRPSLAAHHSARVCGIGECLGFGQPCQKHPSTKTITRSRRNTKSGLPNRTTPRRQPVIRWARSSLIRRSSVSLFPRDRISDMTALRLVLVKTSVIGPQPVIRGDLATALQTIVVDVNSVVETRPLGGRSSRLHLLAITEVDCSVNPGAK